MRKKLIYSIVFFIFVSSHAFGQDKAPSYFELDDVDASKLRLKILFTIIELKVLWCGKINGRYMSDNPDLKNISFSYMVREGIPFETFNIMEDDEIYCIGKVIDIKAIEEKILDNIPFNRIK